MILLQGNGLARDFSGDVLFENVNFAIADKARISLVGRNGAGKSTLLKIIVGEEEPSKGELIQARDLTLSYLAQDTGLSSEKTIFDEMESVFIELKKLEKELENLALTLADGGEEALTRYDNMQESFRTKGGYQYEAEIKSVLNGFQFPESMWQQNISDLSGGQKTRLALAKMLLEKPSLLVLDEPTNHLDIATLSWLEGYLKSYAGALLMVSHDRYFLDQVTTETLELAQGKLTRFSGNYSAYLAQKAVQLESEAKAFDKQQKEINALEDYVARNLARASTTKMAQSRRKRLEKMERLDAPSGKEKSAHLVFEAEKRSGNDVLLVSEAALGYDTVLAAPVSLDLKRGEVVAVVGPNGVGKTTFLKSILGEIPLKAGTVKLGANVMVGYYDQAQEGLGLKNTVLDELWNAHRLLPEVEIRTVLGNFLFSGEDVKKTVGMLSGGEKARLLLAKLSMAHDNFLVLDEPTNHLDIDSRAVLENALIDFEGTILFVSHDRYFINRVATQVLELSKDGCRLYLGNYDYYLEKKAEEALGVVNTEIVKSEKVDTRADDKALKAEERRLTRRIEDLSEKLAAIDQQESEITAEMAENPNDYELLGDWQHTLDRLEKENAALEEALLETMSALEDLGL
ncbi:MAG: ATP-binding cassette domain-containing protein [Streptococcaceae bacterium]|jgi:ATP-binding cassette subfamily F protein 3|nr:ATP-binding cassette domain-containing protein [Streptococcaceae bacterium]